MLVCPAVIATWPIPPVVVNTLFRPVKLVVGEMIMSVWYIPFALGDPNTVLL